MAYKSRVTNKYMGATFAGQVNASNTSDATDLINILQRDVNPALRRIYDKGVQNKKDAAVQKMNELYATKDTTTINKEIFNVAVICLRELGEYTPEIEKLGIKVYLIPQKEGTDYFTFLKVAKILKQEKIDVIHTHNTQPFVDGTIAAILAGVKTIIHTDHARIFPDKKRYMFAEWLMAQFAYKVVGVSNHTSENLIKYEKISKKKIITIPNGVDGTLYNVSINREQKKRELGIVKNGPIIGLGVRLEEQKGITYLLKAMPIIMKEFQDITLLIAGKGNLKNDLIKEASDLGITNNIIFVGPRLDMAELLKLFDLYVLPSLWEGLPMVLLESLAAGCPIVTTDVGGNSTVIKHRLNGSLVEPRNFTSLASEIIRLLKDEELRINYIKNGYEIFNSKYSAKVMTEQYEKFASPHRTKIRRQFTGNSRSHSPCRQTHR